jgi:mannonate dehydratase
MLPSGRWFGPDDSVTLREIRQAGALGVVTALHHIPCGELWAREEIAKRKREIEWDEEKNAPSGLKWTVLESLPVHEDIKTRSGDSRALIETYKQSLRNLAEQGIETVCYNFMPVLDWTRTKMHYELEDGSKTLYCDVDEIAAFDMFILRRKNAEEDYSDEERRNAKALFDSMDDDARRCLADTILLGLPGTVDDLTVPQFAEILARYDGIDGETLRSNLYGFLNEIMPVCEETGVKMAIHPDDPPRSIFGLPRVVSTAEDLARLFHEVPSRNNGLTLCAGSLGGRLDNDPLAILEAFADRTFLAHLRNVKFLKKNTFHETDLSKGRVDMVGMMDALLREENRRKNAGEADWRIPVRPDHGKQLDTDARRRFYGGYSAAGRMIGLAELRGIESALLARTSERGDAL